MKMYEFFIKYHIGGEVREVYQYAYGKSERAAWIKLMRCFVNVINCDCVKEEDIKKAGFDNWIKVEV